MLRRLGIRGKVLAALSVPVLVLTMLAGVVSLGAVQDARTARTVASLLDSLQESREVVTAVQAERRTSLRFVAGEEIADDVAASREVVKDELASFERSLNQVDIDSLDPAVGTAARALRLRISQFDFVRERVDARSVAVRSIATDFGRFIDDLISFQYSVADVLDDRRLAAILSSQADVTALVEAYREEQTIGYEVLLGARGEEEIDYLSSLFPRTDLLHDQVRLGVDDLDLGEGVVVPRLGASFRNGQSYGSYRTLISTGQAVQFDFVREDDFVSRAGEEIDAFNPVTTALRVAAQERAAAVAGNETRTAILTIAAALAAVVLSVIVALSIARQIVNPLRRLTEAAANVRDELPRLVDQVAIPGQGPDLSLTTIPVDSKDEVGQLATAFNEVNATTIQVAQEQAALRGSIAEMFVNVARRDQVLLNRQLSFIDALERSEEDPTTLADLFRLDHLATRMRRNAESLLVLAGIDTGRRLRDALATSDVIRTASSEIEHYERVQLDLPVDPHMLGHTALPAAHMLAEILENATVFSEPGTPVQVSTGVDENDVLITVLDQGLGMSQEELDEANTKIRTNSASDVLGSQRLGLFVVGRIASRLGARVELSRGPSGTGTLVTVRLPHILFTDAAQIPATAPTAPAVVHDTFVRPEQAAEVVHEAAYSPIPAGVEDVAPGSLGSAENPATEVDLAALTDGTTGLGLPKRRSRGDVEPAPVVIDREADDAAAASSIPLAPRAEDLAGVSELDLDAEAWSPPVVEASTPLSVRRGAPDDAPAAGGLPVREPAAGGLPVREPSGGLPTRGGGGGGLPTRQPGSALPAAAAPATPAAPAPAPERAAMFSGFRSRRAELAAAAVHAGQDSAAEAAPAAGSGDGAERLAAAAAFFGRPKDEQPAPEPEAPADDAFVIPALAPDDDDEYGDPVFAPGAPAVVVEPGPADWTAAPAAQTPYLGRHALPPVDEEPPGPDWQPSPSRGAHAWTPDEADDASWTDPAQAAAEPEPVAAPEPVVAPELEPVDTPWTSPEWGTASVEETVVLAPEEAQPTWPPMAEADPWAAPEGAADQPADDAPWAQPTDGAPWAQQADDASWAQPAAADQAAPQDDVVAPAVTNDVPQPGTSVPQPVFEPVVAPEPVAEQPAPKAKRRWWFGRRKDADTTSVPAPHPAPAQPERPISTGFAPIDGLQRESAWSAPSAPEPVVEQPVAEATSEPGPVAFAPDPSVTEPAAPSAPSPEVPAQQTWQSFRPVGQQAPSAPAPAPTTDWQPPQVDIPSAALEGSNAWSPSEAWSPEPEVAAEAPGAVGGLPTRGSFAPQTTFTPQGDTGGAFDDEVTNMLAQKADLAQQALAELSQLSSYRPQTVSGGGSSTLARRTPGTIPAAPAIERKREGARTERDANQVRSLLSNFQSGTNRGRQASDAGSTPTDSVQGAALAGSQDGPEGHGQPVTTPDADLTQRSTSW